MVKFVTFLKPDGSLEGRLQNTVNVSTWETTDTGIANPKFEKITVPLRIPSSLSKNHDEKTLRENVENYKRLLRELYAEELKNIPCDGNQRKNQEKINTITKFLEQLDEKVRLEGPIGSGQYKTYQVVTPAVTKKEREILATAFNQNFSAKDQAECEARFPFCIIEDGKITGRRVPIEILLSAKGHAKDYETHNWKPVKASEKLRQANEEELRKRYKALAEAFEGEELKDWWNRRDLLQGIEKILNDNKDEKLTVSAIIDLDHDDNYLITTLDCGAEEIYVDVPGQDRKAKVKVIKTADQQELIAEDNRITEQAQPLFIYGQNHLKFDYGTAKRLTGNSKPGIDETEPLHEAQVPGGFIKRNIARGRIDIDAAAFSQHYLWTYNNKLDTILLNICGIASKKTMTHDELAVNTAKAEKGDKQAAYDILYYAAQDAMKSFILGTKLKLEHLLLSYLFDSTPARIDTTSKKTLCEGYWANRHFRRKGTYPDPRTMQEGEEKFEKFNAAKEFHKRLGRVKTKKGIQEGYLVAFYPFSHAFRHILTGRRHLDEEVIAIRRRIRETEDVKEKTRLLKGLEALAEYPLFRSMHATEVRFAAEFETGDIRQGIERCQRATRTAIKQIQDLTAEGIININKEFIILPANMPEEDLEKITQDNLGVVLGKGRFLSGTKGRYAGFIDGEFLMHGIADYNSNKGERCAFEKEFYETFLHDVLVKEDVQSALSYLIEKCKIIANRTYTQEEITYRREARKNHTDYSIRANGGHVKRIRQQKISEGDILEYTYSQEEMQEKFFGITPEEKKEKMEKCRGIARYKKERKTGQTHTIDLEEETEQITEKKGTIAEIVNWVFDFRKGSPGDKILQRIYLGAGSHEDVERLMDLHCYKGEQMRLF